MDSRLELPQNPGNEVYCGSDLHFGHDKLIELAPRPVDFEQRIFRNYMQVPWKPGDTLINCGDMALYPRGHKLAEEFNQSLKTLGVHLVLVKGNHDPKSIFRCQRLGFDVALDAMRLVFHGKDLYFTHEPAGVLGNTINIHGHLHDLDGHRGSLARDGKHILLSSELMDYRPISLTRLLQIGTPRWVNGKFERAE